MNKRFISYLCCNLQQDREKLVAASLKRDKKIAKWDILMGGHKLDDNVFADNVKGDFKREGNITTLGRCSPDNHIVVRLYIRVYHLFFSLKMTKFNWRPINILKLLGFNLYN